jgi:hypothetical protein
MKFWKQRQTATKTQRIAKLIHFDKRYSKKAKNANESATCANTNNLLTLFI